MEFSPPAIAQLKEFGLQEYAARAYLALLELGETEARGVSELANIPSAKVYGTLVQLQRRGLVRVTPGKPRQYAPIPIHDFIERHLREQEEAASQLRASMDRLEMMFPLRARSASVERARTSTIVGRRNILQHLRRSCESATGTIFALASPTIHADPAIMRHFARALSRGVQVHVGKDLDPADLAALAEWFPSADLDDTSPEIGGVVIATFDSDAAMLLRLEGGVRTQGHESETAIHTTERTICRALRRLTALHLASERTKVHAPRSASPLAAMHLDATTFAQRAAARAASPPTEAQAVLHLKEAHDLERDGLWQATRVASSARILVNTDSATLGPYVREKLPTHVEVRLLPRQVSVAFAILDGHEAFFASPSSLRPGSKPLYAVTTDPAFVRALQEQFETGWASAANFA